METKTKSEERQGELAFTADSLVVGMNTSELIEAFELTNDKHGLEVSEVRGWLMDELEIRNSEAFEKFLDSTEDSPRAFFGISK